MVARRRRGDRRPVEWCMPDRDLAARSPCRRSSTQISGGRSARWTPGNAARWSSVESRPACVRSQGTEHVLERRWAARTAARRVVISAGRSPTTRRTPSCSCIRASWPRRWPAALPTLDRGRVAVEAESGGGRISLWLAVDHPDLVGASGPRLGRVRDAARFAHGRAHAAVDRAGGGELLGHTSSRGWRCRCGRRPRRTGAGSFERRGATAAATRDAGAVHRRAAGDPRPELVRHRSAWRDRRPGARARRRQGPGRPDRGHAPRGGRHSRRAIRARSRVRAHRAQLVPRLPGVVEAFLAEGDA